ncbi:MAG TPA: DUF6391 domain-containing protein [Anaerolineales bacterium]|nr:DUF6391 domain-containing protein [Anaerolineales bacterium]
MPNQLERLLSTPVLSRIRRNHGLEHGTIHVLSRHYPGTPLVGRSDARGFFLYSSLPIEPVREAVSESLERMRGGEHRLAIHPNCGTNFLTAGLLATVASYFSLFGGRDERWQDRLLRIPFAVLVTSVALILAQPLGNAAQLHLTTQGDPEGLQVDAIIPLRRGRNKLYRVLTSD